MGRNALPQSSPIEEPTLDEGKLIDLQNRAARTMAAIEREYGDDMLYNRDRIIQETRFLLLQSADALFEVGRRLIRLKEHEGHGGLMKALEQIGIDYKAAQRIMRATLKISNRTTSSILNQLDKFKIFEIATLDTDEIEELDQGGTVAGITLDDVDRMSVRELRIALRAHRERMKKDKESADRLLTQKNAKIDELDKALHEQESRPAQPPDWSSHAANARKHLMTHAGAALIALDKLHWVRDAMLTLAGHDVPRNPLNTEAPLTPPTEGELRALAVQYEDSIRQIYDEWERLEAIFRDSPLGGIAEIARMGEPNYKLSELPTAGELINASYTREESGHES